MDNLFNSGISIEKMAAFLDGNLSASEMQDMSAIIEGNSSLQKMMEVSDQIDKAVQAHPEDYAIPSDLISDGFEIPTIENTHNQLTMAVAAGNVADNFCDISCEGYILRHFGENVTDEELRQESIASGWLTSRGTQLPHIGKLSEAHGLKVERKYHATFDDIATALSAGAMVMVCVDEGELTGNLEHEKIEDVMIGKRPDHVVIVSCVDKQNVTIIDPYTPQLTDFYTRDQFEDAWEDSEKYIIITKKRQEWIFSSKYFPQSEKG